MTKFGLIVWLLLCSVMMMAQEKREAVDSAAMEYFRRVRSFSPLYYGSEYEVHPRTTNHPYLIDDQYAKARLSYQHIIYPEVLLRLDLNRDELVVQSPGFRNIILRAGNVDFAELHGKHIIYFQKDSLSGCPSSGYYMLLYSGNCKLLEKRHAQLTEKIGLDLLERYFALTTQYYLYKDGSYYSIRNKRGLLKVLHPYRKELKRFVSSRKLNFKVDAEEFLILTVNEYEQLAGL